MPSAVAFVAAVPLLHGCSDDSEKDDAAAMGGSAGDVSVDIGGRNAGGTGQGTGGGAVVSSGGSTSCSIEDDGSGCVGEAHEGESIPLDIYIMFDQSGSMCSCIDPEGGQLCPDPNCNATRMDAVREATGLFLADPESYGIGIGIGYFGKQPIGQANCDVAEYSNAAVGIGPLPDQASAIMDSLGAIAPTGETPTAPAIRGACEYVQSWKAEHPSRQVVILLLTDGKPEAPATCPNGSGPCCPTLPDAVAAAGECLSDAGVKTYVLGVGPLLQNLEQIAVAGGTEQAYLVEGGNVSADVLDALNRIRGAAIPCEFSLPDPPQGQTLAYDQVNITYANAACQATYYSYVETVDLCGDEGGWYYDDPLVPQKAQLCPTSCNQVGAPGGRLLFTVGCATRIQIQ